MCEDRGKFESVAAFCRGIFKGLSSYTEAGERQGVSLMALTLRLTLRSHGRQTQPAATTLRSQCFRFC